MIYYQVNMQDLTRIEQALGMMKDKSAIVLRSAINSAAKDIEKQMIKGAKKRYVLKEGAAGFKAAHKPIRKATTRSLTATIRVVGPVEELTDYMISPPTYFPGSKGAPSWIKAKVKRSGRLQGMALRKGGAGDQYKGFVVHYTSGHEAFAERVPGSRMRGKDKEKIRSLHAPSKPKAEEMVLKEDVGELDAILMRHIQKAIPKFLK